MATHELRLLLPEHPANTGTAFFGAGAVYLAAALLAALLTWLQPPAPFRAQAAAESVNVPTLIFRNVLGPAGGGGGGGNSTPLDQPRAAPTPAIRPPEPAPPLEPIAEPVPEPEPVPLAATVSAARNDMQLAIVNPTANSGSSLGPGTNGAGGPGDRGVGPGTDGGLGPGAGPNTGGGPYGPGDVDVQVVAIQVAKPGYTTEALHRRVQGTAELSCIVLATGRVGACRITRSLDGNNFGLDDEALKAAAKFLFKPAMRKGQPVPVEVRIILDFRIQ